MIPGMRRAATVAITTATLATLTACDNAPEPRRTPAPVSLAQATKVLTIDGQKIAGLLQVKTDQIDDEAKVDDPKGCPSGAARRSFSMSFTDELGADVHEELVTAIGYANSQVSEVGYQRLRDANRKDDSRGEVLVTEFRKPDAKVGFTVSVWADGAELVQSVAGRTDCLR